MKKTACFLITVVLIFSFIVPSFAQQKNIIDNADVLTESEEASLENFISQKRAEDLFDIVIVTEHYVEDLQTFADDFYDLSGYGVGENADGLLLLVTDYGCYLSTSGFGIDAIDPYLSELSDDFHINADENGYSYAFEKFIEGVSVCVKFKRECVESGLITDDEDYDNPDYYFLNKNLKQKNGIFSGKVDLYYVVFSLIGGVCVAFFVTSSMKRKLTSVRIKTEANDCVRKGSVNITRSYDDFLYRTVSRIPRPKNNNSSRSGGGFSGGTHTSSSGRTHGGGKF